MHIARAQCSITSYTIWGTNGVTTIKYEKVQVEFPILWFQFLYDAQYGVIRVKIIVIINEYGQHILNSWREIRCRKTFQLARLCLWNFSLPSIVVCCTPTRIVDLQNTLIDTTRAQLFFMSVYFIIFHIYTQMQCCY